LGWRFRFDLDLSHPAVRRGARLGVWALGYAGGYQAGLIVVLLLANKVEGGVAAYQWAYTFFYLPHALFALPLFHVLFTAMSEHIARDEPTEFLGRLRGGLAMLGFLLLPLSAFLLVAAEPLTRLTLEYGVMTDAGARQVAVVLIAFVVGLPTYSTFLVFTRAFYAFGEVKLPALINAASVAMASAFGAVFFFLLPGRDAVAGLALGHSVGFALGAALIARAFSRRWAPPADDLARSLRRSAVVTLVALGAMAGVEMLLPSQSKVGLAVTLMATALTGGAVYLVGMKLTGAPELRRLRSLLPGAPA
jgi:putative peptidoglycan lipid II flippase